MTSATIVGCFQVKDGDRNKPVTIRKTAGRSGAICRKSGVTRFISFTISLCRLPLFKRHAAEALFSGMSPVCFPASIDRITKKRFNASKSYD